jgi:hypothetical protein
VIWHGSGTTREARTNVRAFFAGGPDVAQPEPYSHCSGACGGRRGRPSAGVTAQRSAGGGGCRFAASASSAWRYHQSWIMAASAVTACCWSSADMGPVRGGRITTGVARRLPPATSAPACLPVRPSTISPEARRARASRSGYRGWRRWRASCSCNRHWLSAATSAWHALVGRATWRAGVGPRRRASGSY